ncbi:MAG: hypothetical protein GF401_16555 [Chitinivibrionales bacterium]|nr:hypothetical protein [Chitinivibrionales bacterium]
MLTKFFPWKFFLKRLSKAHGFIDPLALLASFNRFSQPAEMVAPTELMRAGAVLHARGLLNSQAIQHNLDWVWPYWVSEQFSPTSSSFIPRAFAITHINLTHRNWTAVGIPGMKHLPIVDPRGLVTPLFDSWSIDCWVLDNDGDNLIPSRMKKVNQKIHHTYPLQVITESSLGSNRLRVTTEACMVDGMPVCVIRAAAQTGSPGVRLMISVRPYNPEGISLLESIQPLSTASGWLLNGKHQLHFDVRPEMMWYSDYRQGDVYQKICTGVNGKEQQAGCKIGMATAAAQFDLTSDKEREVVVTVPLQQRKSKTPIVLSLDKGQEEKPWRERLEGACKIEIPDKHYQFLYENSLRTMLLHSWDDIVAGPYTYKRFWFRDAVLIAHAMYLCGLESTADSALARFPKRQNALGYFVSQEGEWDANGQVLWIFDMAGRLAGKAPNENLRKSIIYGADWICRKIVKGKKESLHGGLLPAGFSAEHFGPNDYYYWDDFWAIAGLRGAARMMEALGDSERARNYENQANSVYKAVIQSLARVSQASGNNIMPVSPYRRPDSASVGSLAAAYPLQVFAPDDRRILDTAEYLYDFCTVNNALFHDISHSGINAYLTLHIAQAFLRTGDSRYAQCMETIARLASDTGQWPEAIHPQLETGCMGDGQHVWAAAEWAIMVRNLFVREEYGERKLVLCSGVLRDWVKPGAHCSFGPTATSFGPVTVHLHRSKDGVEIQWKGEWRGVIPQVEVAPIWGTVISKTAGSAQVDIKEEGV